MKYIGYVMIFLMLVVPHSMIFYQGGFNAMITILGIMILVYGYVLTALYLISKK